MKNSFKKLLCIILSLCIIFACASVSFAAYEATDKIPIVLIPGFGQSETMVYDESGKCLGDISEFSLESMKTNEILKSLTSPSKLSALVKKHSDFPQYVHDVLSDLFAAFRHNPDGTPVYRTEVRHFNNPYSKLSAEEKAEVDKHISLRGLSAYNDLRYYFTYDTFGSVKQAADDLHEYITEIVLKQTGAEKVNLVPVSQGGALFVEYLDLYKEDYKYINKVIGIVPAYDGSTIVGDVLTDEVTIYDTEYFRSVALPSVIKTLTGKEYLGYAAAMALRCIFSDATLEKVLRKALEAAIECLACNNSMMWALCPTEFYEKASERLISDEAHVKLKAETDRYELAKENFTANLATLINDGTVIHNIASYGVGCYLSCLFEHGSVNADDLLTPSSPGLGAVSANNGTTLGDNYVSPHTYCNDHSHNHISPDNVIDASTGFLPENTWYFKGISHMGLNGREDIKNFAAQLILNDDIVDVHTFPGQQQFVELPEYQKVINEEKGVIYYYDDAGDYMYSEKIPDNSSHLLDKLASTFYKGFNLLYKFVSSVIHK